MKKLNTIFNFLLAFVILAIAGANPIISLFVAGALAIALNFVPAIPGLLSGFITNGSEFYGQELQDIIIRPILKKELAKELGARVFLAVKSSVKLTFFGPTTKILKAYADGWQGGAAAAKNQKKLLLTEFKAEQALSKQAYKNTIMEQITDRGGIAQNDITGTIVQQAELAVFMAGVKEDARRIFWLGSTTKKFVQSGVRYDSSADVVVDANGAWVSGGKDIFYNAANGIWKAIFGSAATSPTAAQIKRIAIDNGCVAQVDTHTLTGTSGTANIVINGVSYLVTFNTTLTQTATDFAALYLTALAALDITVTSSGATVILTSAVAGQPFVSVAAANATGNQAGTLAATTANVLPQDLSVDEGIATLKKCFEQGSTVLKNFLSTLSNAKQARFYVTDTILNNYRDTLEALGTLTANTLIVDGQEFFTYRGVPIMTMGIDDYLSTDFISPYKHRVLLTVPNNLALVLNGANDDSELRMWFQPDYNENRQRIQFEFGMDFILPEWMCVAY